MDIFVINVIAPQQALLVRKWPHTNPASDRENRNLGRVSFFATGNGMVVNMYAQRNPGAPNMTNDTSSVRLNTFMTCLTQIAETYIHGYNSIYLPSGVGCGLAKGDWADYHNAIITIANAYPHRRFVIVHKNNEYTCNYVCRS